jgi:hypothetical protein
VPADPDQAASWLTEALSALGLTSTGIIGWALRTNGRLTTLETRREATDARLEKIEDGVDKILNHLTGMNLHGRGD